MDVSHSCGMLNRRIPWGSQWLSQSSTNHAQLNCNEKNNQFFPILILSQFVLQCSKAVEKIQLTLSFMNISQQQLNTKPKGPTQHQGRRTLCTTIFHFMYSYCTNLYIYLYIYTYNMLTYQYFACLYLKRNWRSSGWCGRGERRDEGQPGRGEKWETLVRV